MSEYAGILVITVFSAALVLIFLFLTTVLGPKRPNAAKNEPFECGQKPLTSPGSRVSVHFYLIAMLFILFDVELAFLFPWAVLFKKLGIAGLIEVFIFVFLIVLGYLYAYKKGALEAK